MVMNTQKGEVVNNKAKSICKIRRGNGNCNCTNKVRGRRERPEKVEEDSERKSEDVRRGI